MDTNAEVSAFVQSHGQRLLRVAYLLEGSQVGAEDLLQDTLLRVVERWPTVQRSRHVHAYTRKILVNQHISRTRKQSAARELLTDNSDLPDMISPDPAEVMARRVDLMEALRKLPVRQRTVIVLSFYEDLPDKTIGKLMGITPSSVRSALSRGLETLRREAVDLNRKGHHVF